MAIDDRVLTDERWPRLTARSLLLLLLSSPGHRLPRDRVVDTLWPESTPESGLNALYSALHALRRTLEPDGEAGRASAYVEARGGSIGLRAMPGLYVDVEAFADAIRRAGPTDGTQRASALREALALYGGDFMADEPYADWPVPTRERLRLDWRRAVLDLAELEREAGRPLAALQPLEMLLATDGTDEAVHRALMQAQAAAGRRDEALRHYQRCVRALNEELGAAPSDETTALARAIEAAPPAPVTTRPALHLPPLPSLATRLIGRATEVAALRYLLADRDVRLVTIVGPGGVGKTRLALEVARVASESFAAGASFVPLATIRDPLLVLPTIARTLGIKETASRPAAEQLRDALYEREVLLVLDNFEQVIEGAPEIGVLLEGSAGLRLLVTSRERLHVRAEQVHLVAPLSAPLPSSGSSGPQLSLAKIGELDSVRLFVDRVRAVRPGFALGDANGPAIAAICARLEGLPLAIELAAARGGHLSPTQMLARLERRLPLLTGGPRDLPARLRTMHAAIAWSYDLLAEPERRLFRRLAVFVGGCTLEAVEAVVTALDDGRAQTEAQQPLDLVGSLADKSLVRLDGDDDRRVSMLETIREFAMERLAEQDDEDAARRAHASFFLELAERAAPELTGPDQAAWLDRLEVEHDNIRQTFETLLATDMRDGALRLGRALSRFWRMHGHYVEGRSRVELALARAGPPSVARARALTTAADLAEAQGDYERAEALYRDALAISNEHGDELGIADGSLGLSAVALGRAELPAAVDWAQRALGLYRELGDRRGTASALNYLATVAFHRGEFDVAAELWDECLRLLGDLGDRRAMSIGLSNLGVLELQRGQPEQAIARHQAALAIFRGLGDKWGITHSLMNLGRVQVSLGRARDARPSLEEALAYCRELGDPIREGLTHEILGLAAIAEGDVAEATAHLARSLELCRQTGNRIVGASVLENAARVMALHAAAGRASRLLGAAEALREQVGAVRETVDQPHYDRTLQTVRSALSTAEFDALWAAGRNLAFEDATAEAISVLTSRVHWSAAAPSK